MSRTHRSASARLGLAVPALSPVAPTWTATYELAFLTPVFGGGVRVDEREDHRQVKERDPVTPVRSASIRGQLRAWWRRTCGFDASGAPLPLQVLRDREALLWGWASTTERPRRGWISVHVDTSPLRHRSIAVFEVRRERWQPSVSDGAAYGVFPLMPREGRADLRPGELHRYDGTFAITLTAGALADRGCAASVWSCGDDDLDDILWNEAQRAVRAWATFGGFGARTRRGFGAVTLVKDRPMLSEVLDDLGWASRVAEWPSSFAVKTDRIEAGQRALSAGLGALKSFRQGVGVGRNPGRAENRPGRSRWPEPDELRRLTRRHDPRHAPVHVVRRFPRAAFGLPIVFHFQGGGQEPPDKVLQPHGAERLASPLVIRPVQDADGTIKVIALRLPERTPLDAVLSDLELRDGPSGLSGALTAAEQAQITPLAEHRAGPAAGADAVLDPFLRYFRGNPR